MNLEKVIQIPKNDNRVNDILHGLRNRKFSYHQSTENTSKWKPSDLKDFKVQNWHESLDDG